MKSFIFFLISISFKNVAVKSSDLEISQLVHDCGFVNSDLGLINSKRASNEFETPWKVAIFRKELDGDLGFICGGSLISKSLIVTAAHCVHEKGSSKTKANDLLTILGANNLEDWNEEGRQNRTVKGVFEHSKWDASNLRYSNDIAVLLLNDEVSFTTHIQPICLLTDEREIKTGKVVGWGAVDDYGNTADVAKIAELETISFIHCILNFTRLSFIAWDASFCALSKVDGVCKGDSGSGFYVEIEGRYYLKGIVSSRATKQLNSCVDNQVALYSDISKYIKFIKDNFLISLTMTTQKPAILIEDSIHFEETNPRPKPFHIFIKGGRQPMTNSRQCEVGEWLYPEEHSNNWKCDCKPGHVYSSEHDTCFELYSKGPCGYSYFYMFPSTLEDTKFPKCIFNICVRRGKNFVPFGDQCLKLNSAESCELYNKNYKDAYEEDGDFKVRLDPTDNKSLACIDRGYRYACANEKCRLLKDAKLWKKI